MFTKQGQIIAEVKNLDRKKFNSIVKKYGRPEFIHTKSYSGAVILKGVNIFLGTANLSQAGRGIYLSDKLEEFKAICVDMGLEVVWLDKHN